MNRKDRKRQLRATAILASLLLVPLASLTSRADTQPVASGDALMDIAAGQLQRGEISGAVSNIKTALQNYQATANITGQCNALEYLIAITQKTGPREQFLGYLNNAAKIDQVADRCGQGFQVWRFLGETYVDDGQSLAAVDAFERAAANARRMSNTENEAMAVAFLGRENERLGKTKDATDNYLRALLLARQSGATYTAAAALWDLGKLSMTSEDYVGAKSFYWQALTLVRETGETDKEIDALWRLGTVHYYLGDYRQAIEYLVDSATLAEKNNASNAHSRATRSLGNTYYQLGDLGNAINAYDTTLRLARTENNKAHIAYALGNLALIHLARRDYSKAISYLEEDLIILRALGDRQNEAQALSNLGLVYAEKGDTANAKKFFRTGIALSRDVGYTRGVGMSLTNLGRLHLKANSYAEAERALREATSVFDTLREPAAETDAFNSSLFETQLRTYRLLQVAVAAQGKHWQALEAAELGRSRAFADLLARRQSAHESGVSKNSVLKQNQITALAKTNDITIVTYSVLPDRGEIYCWVIDASGKMHFSNMTIDRVQDLVAHSRQSIGIGTRGVTPVRPPQEDQQRSLRKLYAALIEPIEAYLPRNPDAEIVFVPHDALFLVPFAALMRPDGSYLIDHHAISVAPSISVLKLAGDLSGRSENPARHALIVGNPSYERSQLDAVRDLPALPGAEREAHQVAALLGAKPLIGSQATRANVIQDIQGAPIVHFATHGLLETTIDAIPGAIVLAAGAGDDGLLTASQVMDLKMSAGLVVLSACDTGRGAITGDGVVGLSRSFMAAGVSSIIVSLWSIPDGPTSELMIEFYKRLQTTENLAVALREAMIAVREQNPEPKDWAAFSLVGESAWEQ